MQINSFTGIRNLVPARSISDNSLADCLDLDLTDAGGLQGRLDGIMSLSVPITSAYSTTNRDGYVISNGMLCQVGEGLSVTPLIESSATEFCDFGNMLFTNDGIKVDNGKATSLKMPFPSEQLVLIPSSGDLPKGIYRATYAYKSLLSGIETGSAPPSEIEISSGGFYIAPPTAPSGYRPVVYVTEANGTVFYSTDTDIQLSPMQVLADPFPDKAEKVAYHESRLYVSRTIDGKTLINYSKPKRPHLFEYKSDWFFVPGIVHCMMSANGALLIGTGTAIYAYQGKVLTPLAHYGVPMGRAMTKTPGGNVLIHSNRGTCRALPFENITETKCSIQPGQVCSTAILDTVGIHRFVAMKGGESQSYNENFPLSLTKI